MIEPVQSGETLLNDIATTTPQPDQIAIWWLGQSGYAIKTSDTIFYLDLYLSEHLTHKYANTEKPHVRITSAPLRGGDLRDVPLVFASHKHSDHLDPGTLPPLFAANPDAKLILPQAHVAHTVAMGIEESRLMPVRGDNTITHNGLTIHAIPSSHPALDYTDADGYPHLGFVIETGAVTLYHSGDTIVYDGLAERLRRYNLDLAFLPINGAAGGTTPPNMNADEAIALAAEIGKPLVIPHHYDMFTFNTADVNVFAQKADAASQPYKILQNGERFIFTPSRAI